MHDRYAEGDYEHVGLANVRVAFVMVLGCFCDGFANVRVDFANVRG